MVVLTAVKENDDCAFNRAAITDPLQTSGDTTSPWSSNSEAVLWILDIYGRLATGSLKIYLIL